MYDKFLGERNHALSVSVSTTGSIPRRHSDVYCLQVVSKDRQLLEAFNYHLELKAFSTFHYENFQTYQKDNVVQSSNTSST